MAIAKPVRIILVVILTLLLYFLYSSKDVVPEASPQDAATKFRIDKEFIEPNLQSTLEPAEPLHRVDGNNYDPNNQDSDRINAALVSLVRNSELEDMISSMRDLEHTFNHKFNYPWVFLNDVPFTEEFKTRILAETKANVTFDLVPKEHWDVPAWINDDLYEASVFNLKRKGVQYMDKKSYHQMCRWNSGMFYRHPALLKYKWYWRVEPNVHFFCQLDYDVFRWMQDHNKTYGFTINLYDFPETVTSLWPETMRFITDNVKYINPNNALKWLQDSTHRPDYTRRANGYSTCHFWSNFEIADMDFFRGEAYENYFRHLDLAGGFFYERWGDAPVHSIALGLFEDRNKIHWFRDIGYQHIPFFNCPNSPKCHGCTPGKFTDGEAWLHREDCRPVWFKETGFE